jgi:guanylate kinase
VDGVHYRFLSPATFQQLIEESAFLEWAEVFGHRYGTLMGPIAEDLTRSRNVVLEIDVQGAATIKAQLPEAILVFLEPPSEEELARRLTARRTESGAALERRLAAAREEMRESSWFDHVVVNDDMDRAASEVASIIDARTAT